MLQIFSMTNKVLPRKKNAEICKQNHWQRLTYFSCRNLYIHLKQKNSNIYSTHIHILNCMEITRRQISRSFMLLSVEKKRSFFGFVLCVFAFVFHHRVVYIVYVYTFICIYWAQPNPNQLIKVFFYIISICDEFD